MRKKLKWITLILLVVSIFWGMGCENELPNFYMDTVLTLAKSTVKVHAYPGMNYIYWTHVPNAKSYVLYIHEAGTCISSEVFEYVDGLSFVDTNIKDGVEYTYYIEAESIYSESRAVVMQNSMSNGVSVKAIVPPSVNEIEELCRYEQTDDPYYDAYRFIMTNSQDMSISSTINQIHVKFPGKAYLMYKVSLLDSDGKILQQSAVYDHSKNNVYLCADFEVEKEGFYKVQIEVRSVNPCFCYETYTSDSIYVAPWKIIIHFVDENGIPLLEPKTLVCPGLNDSSDWKTIVLPEIPEKEGFFVTEEYWRDLYNVQYTPNSSYTIYDSTKTFIAEYRAPIERIVYFCDENRNQILDPIRLVETEDPYWNRIYLPEIPEKEGYPSLHWRDDGGDMYFAGSYEDMNSNSPDFYFYAVYDTPPVYSYYDLSYIDADTFYQSENGFLTVENMVRVAPGHGIEIGSDTSVKITVPGRCYLYFQLCGYGEHSPIRIFSSDGTLIADLTDYTVSDCGILVGAPYYGGPDVLTIVWDTEGSRNYLHGIETRNF